MKLQKALVFSTDAANIPGLCSGANTLAERSAAVLLGTRAAAEALLPNADKVIWLGERAEGAMAESYTGAIERAVRAEGATLVLVSGGTRDRCIAAKLAVRLNAGVIADAGAVRVAEDGAIEARRNVFGGAAEAELKSRAAITILIVASGAFDDCLPAQPGVLEQAQAEPEQTGVTLVSTAAKQEEAVDIAVARRIVGVGRGVGSQEKLAGVETFAAKLGAELGCTRPVAEEERWMARGRYIGVSGVTVKPELYFALGISGQVQHLIGVNEAKIIVAVNKDAKAPIFQNCDIGLVADMNKVLPALTELF